MARFEPYLLALCLAAWTVTLVHYTGLVSLAGNLRLGLYGLYSLAACGGWLAGNVYVRRRAGLPRELWKRFLVVYLFGPPGFLFFLRSLAPAAEQLAAPLVAVYAAGVYSLFFAVPVTFTRTAPRRDGR